MPWSPDILLLVDDDTSILASTCRVLEQERLGQCLTASSGRQALSLVASHPPALVLLDLGLPDLPGEQVLNDLRRNYPEVVVVVVTALVDVDSAVRCMSAGAYDYVVKGGDPARLISSVKRALESRRKDLEIAALRERMQASTLKTPGAFSAIVTNSERIRALFRFIEAVAATDEPILLRGETGTGKELFAQAVHLASAARGPFVATNLGGLDDFVFSDTLFGHTKGAYTGADELRKGMVAAAAGGTIFLDEIGDLSSTSQVKLLRFLENREYFPLGSDLLRHSDARIVAATNRNLEALADEGKFRRDLLYRLSTYQIDIPPLRDRREDIPLLCDHFLSTLRMGNEHPLMTPEARALLVTYDFPGNVRELRGILMRAKVMAEGRPLDAGIFEALLGRSPALSSSASIQTPAAPLSFAELPTIRRAVSQLVERAMTRTKGNQAAAAKLLGITPQALSKRLKRRGGTSAEERAE